MQAPNPLKINFLNKQLELVKLRTNDSRLQELSLFKDEDTENG